MNPRHLVNKLLLSTLVVFSFIAYALHKAPENSNGGISAVPPTPDPFTAHLDTTPTQANSSTLPAVADSQQSLPTIQTAPSEATATSAVIAVPSTSTPVPTPSKTATRSAGQYKDGSYIGPEVNAFYGLLKVQVIIQNGKIADVQFLEYPNDRRTSVRINNIAIPYLQQEAIQAQSANVNIITGATLTSEAFIRSFQSALAQAKS